MKKMIWYLSSPARMRPGGRVRVRRSVAASTLPGGLPPPARTEGRRPGGPADHRRQEHLEQREDIREEVRPLLYRVGEGEAAVDERDGEGAAVDGDGPPAVGVDPLADPRREDGRGGRAVGGGADELAEDALAPRLCGVGAAVGVAVVVTGGRAVVEVPGVVRVLRRVEEGEGSRPRRC